MVVHTGNVRKFPRLTVFTDVNLRGRRRIIRGDLGIRDLAHYLGWIESLRFFATDKNATLVVFSRPNFRGKSRIYRGNTTIRNLDSLIGGHDVESIISCNRRLSFPKILIIRATGLLPHSFRVL